METREAEAAMVAMLRRYRAQKLHLEEARERGRIYLEQVRREVEMDLAGLERAFDETRESLELMLREERGGEKFRVPGLGTAYLTKRRRTRIVDPEAFLARVRRDAPEDVEQFYDEPRLNTSRIKTYAEAVLTEEGELLPGVESEEVETLGVRLSGRE